jgi:methylaspartate ammonia-lyase
MKISEIVTSVGFSGYFNMDYKAIRSRGPELDGFIYPGEPMTAGFTAIKQPGEAVSVMLILDDGQVAWGDCVDVIFTASAGRDPLFKAREHLPVIEGQIAPMLVGREVEDFRSLAGMLSDFHINRAGLHTAVRYGVSQALLDAVAKARRLTMAEVVAQEYGTTISEAPIPILAMTTTWNRIDVDKMILKKVPYIPHASFTNMTRDVGRDGRKLLDYAAWLRERVQKIGTADYRPTLHLDVYGTLGEAFDCDAEKTAGFLGKMAEATRPYRLILESPYIAATQEEQMESLKALRTEIKSRKIPVEIVADEWCNSLEDIKAYADQGVCDIIQIKTPDLGEVSKTIEAVLYCKDKGVGAYVGGSANETDQSARVSAHIAMATRADILIAKPGEGTDEALVVEYNEMKRILSLKGKRSCR